MNVIGNIFDSSGYSIHTRELANALNKLTKVSLKTNLIPGWERLVSDEELEMIKREPDDINLIITNPLNWRLHTTAKRNWVYLVWEGDKVPDYFIEECLNPDIEYIFVPSKHTISAILMTSELKLVKRIIQKISIFTIYNQDTEKIQEKLKLIPHGVDLNKFYPINSPAGKGGEPVKGSPSRFTFLVNKGFRHLEDRGGTQYAIKAFIEEFKNEDVKLLIKINPAYGVPDLQKILKELGYTGDKIIFDFNHYDYNDLVKLYNKCEVFVAPTRAEAFGLPMIEAMACGLPVITTDFGGQTDFCTNKTGWLIPGKLTEVKHELQYEGINWLTPDIKKLREAMRVAYSKDLTKLKENALKTAKQYTWENTAKKIISLI